MTMDRLESILLFNSEIKRIDKKGKSKILQDQKLSSEETMSEYV